MKTINATTDINDVEIQNVVNKNDDVEYVNTSTTVSNTTSTHLIPNKRLSRKAKQSRQTDKDTGNISGREAQEEYDPSVTDVYPTGFNLVQEGLKLLLNSHPDMKVLYLGDSIMKGLHLSRVEGIPVSKLPKPIERFKRIDLWGEDLNRVFEATHKDLSNFWGAIYETENGGKISTILRNSDIPGVGREKTTSLRGDKVADKRIPALVDFPKSIQDLTPDKLLACFHDAEIKTLMLHIGRIAAGAPFIASDLKSEIRVGNGLVVDGILKPGGGGEITHRLEHKYRSIIMINGEPALGKSTLQKYLDDGFIAAGYSSETLPRSNNQFGWEKAKTDHMFCSDMDVKGTEEILSNVQIKEIASGEFVNMEAKGVNGAKGRPTAALTIFCNNIAFPKLKDAGILIDFIFAN